MNYTMRGYETEALGQIRQAAHYYKRILFTMPTGAGKTLLACELVKTAREKMRYVLFLAYSEEVIKQTSSKLTDYGLEHGIIKAGYRPSLMANTQVASIMTLIRRELPFVPDVIFVDEAHRTMAKSYRQIIDACPDAWVIGLTATPCRMDGKGLGDVYQRLVIGVSMEELIKLGYLVPTKVYAPYTPDLRGVGTRGGDYKEEELEKIVNKPKLVGNIVEHWHRLAKGKRTICFATTLGHSNALVEDFRNTGVTAEHLDGETPMARRHEVLEEQERGNISVVSVVGLLQEGWDAPWVECMVGARPSKSLRWYMQTAGRTLRPCPEIGKEHALILDHAGNTMRFGFVHWDIDWTLDKSTSINKEHAKERKKKGLLEWVCPNCHFINEPPSGYSAQRVCASCGLKHVKVNGVAVKDGQLKELLAAHRKRTPQDRERIWKSCIAIAVSRNQKAGAAAAIYKSRTGVWPRNLQQLDGVNMQSKARAVWPGFMR